MSTAVIRDERNRDRSLEITANREAKVNPDGSTYLAKLDVLLSTRARLQPWYQPNAVAQNRVYNEAVGPHSLTPRWTYTVPSARIAIVYSAIVEIMRETAPTTAGQALAIIQVKDASDTLLSQLVSVREISASVGVQRVSCVGWSALLGATQSLKAYTVDLSTGGTYRFGLSANILEFNT